jgi:hypothetical protein
MLHPRFKWLSSPQTSPEVSNLALDNEQRTISQLSLPCKFYSWPAEKEEDSQLLSLLPPTFVNISRGRRLANIVFQQIILDFTSSDYVHYIHTDTANIRIWPLLCTLAGWTFTTLNQSHESWDSWFTMLHNFRNNELLHSFIIDEEIQRFNWTQNFQMYPLTLSLT